MTHGIDISPHYPCQFSLEIFLTDGKGVGKVNYQLPHGLHPTEANIRKAMDEAVKAAKAAAPGEWRLCNRHEFVDQIVQETMGQRVAVPGPKDFRGVALIDKIGADELDRIIDQTTEAS